MTTTTPLSTGPGQHEPGVTDAETNLELKEVEGLSQGQIVRKRFFRHRGALVSMVVLALIIITAFTSVGVQFGDWKSGGWWIWSWNSITPVENGGRPTLSIIPFAIGDHPFGQDQVGRDIFAIVMRGTQQSLQIMVIVGLIATTIGTVIGSVTGYYRKWVDSVLMRFTDIVITIPVIVIGAVLGRTYGIQGAGVLGDHPRPGVLDRHGAPGARRVPEPARARVRRCRARGRGERRQDHVPPHPAERGRRDHRQRDAAHGRGDPASRRR